MTTQAQIGFIGRLFGREKKRPWEAVLVPGTPANIPENQRLFTTSCRSGKCTAVYTVYLRAPLPSKAFSWVDQVKVNIDERIAHDCPHHPEKMEGES